VYNLLQKLVIAQGNKDHEDLSRRRELCRENHHGETVG